MKKSLGKLVLVGWMAASTVLMAEEFEQDLELVEVSMDCEMELAMGKLEENPPAPEDCMGREGGCGNGFGNIRDTRRKECRPPPPVKRRGAAKEAMDD